MINIKILSKGKIGNSATWHQAMLTPEAEEKDEDY